MRCSGEVKFRHQETPGFPELEVCFPHGPSRLVGRAACLPSQGGRVLLPMDSLWQNLFGWLFPSCRFSSRKLWLVIYCSYCSSAQRFSPDPDSTGWGTVQTNLWDSPWPTECIIEINWAMSNKQQKRKGSKEQGNTVTWLFRLALRVPDHLEALDFVNGESCRTPELLTWPLSQHINILLNLQVETGGSFLNVFHKGGKDFHKLSNWFWDK